MLTVAMMLVATALTATVMVAMVLVAMMLVARPSYIVTQHIVRPSYLVTIPLCLLDPAWSRLVLICAAPAQVRWVRFVFVPFAHTLVGCSKSYDAHPTGCALSEGSIQHIG